MKYIMFELPMGPNLKRAVPVIFPNALTHSVIAEALLKTEDLAGATVVAAGDITFCLPLCSGSSSTLKLSAGEADSAIVNSIDFMHGIIDTGD